MRIMLFLGLLETRVKKNKAQLVAARIAPHWQLENNYAHATNGRIWVIWDTNAYDVTVLSQHTQYMHCNIIAK